MKYMTEHGKSYGTREEFEFRLARFIETDAKVAALNADENQTAVFGHNKFSDWTVDELKKIRGGKTPENHEQTISLNEVEENSWYPINWVAAGKVQPIQDQGRCGSCWSFATTSVMESVHAIATGRLDTKLSEQQLVDCSSRYGNHGCQGGYAGGAYTYAIQNLMESEYSYPYRA